MKVVVLLSGGMDSTTVAAMAVQQHGADNVHALNMYYGQKHAVEKLSAQAVVEHLGIDNYTLKDISTVYKGLQFASSLLEGGPEVDDNQQKNQVGATFVPARNSILLSIAAGYADAVGANQILYGAHSEDHNGYPDCRPEFITAMSRALSLGTVNGVIVNAPFGAFHKADIVRAAARVKAPLQLTHSCYRGHQPACGTCPTCELRIDAFKTAGYIDPIEYEIDIDWTGCQTFPSML